MKVKVFILIVILLFNACGQSDNEIDPIVEVAPIVEVEENIASLSLHEFKEKIANLTLEEFFNQSFEQLLLRDPELVLRQGLSQQLALTEITFTKIDRDYTNETKAFYDASLARLNTFDINTMTTVQKQNHDVYIWWLEDQLSLMAYPQFQINSLNALELNQFFIGLYTITNEENALHFIDQLSSLANQYTIFRDLLNDRKQQGIVDPNVLVDHVINQLNSIISQTATNDPIYQYFSQSLLETNLTLTRQEQLTSQVKGIIEQQIKPAQTNLIHALESMLPQAPQEIGFSQYPLGNEYYQALLNHHLTAKVPAEQAFQLGIDELNQIKQKIVSTFDVLGYPPEDNLQQLYQRLEENAHIVEKQEVVGTFQTLVNNAHLHLSDAFGDIEVPRLEVVASHQDGYFPASKDGNESAIFVANNQRDRYYYPMPSLAYHEGVPGHHLQSSIAQSLSLPLLRTLPTNNAFVEGWALYTEQLAFELGWYAENELSKLGRLQWQALRAARLVADIGVNQKNWDWDEATEFLVVNTGMPLDDISGFVARFVVNAGQATSYSFGMMELLALRQELKDAQGENFDLTNFHQVILNSGPMPISLLKQQFNSN